MSAGEFSLVAPAAGGAAGGAAAAGEVGPKGEPPAPWQCLHRWRWFATHTPIPVLLMLGFVLQAAIGSGMSVQLANAANHCDSVATSNAYPDAGVRKMVCELDSACSYRVFSSKTSGNTTATGICDTKALGLVGSITTTMIMSGMFTIAALFAVTIVPCTKAIYRMPSDPRTPITDTTDPAYGGNCDYGGVSCLFQPAVACGMLFAFPVVTGSLGTLVSAVLGTFIASSVFGTGHVFAWWLSVPGFLIAIFTLIAIIYITLPCPSPAPGYDEAATARWLEARWRQQHAKYNPASAASNRRDCMTIGANRVEHIYAHQKPVVGIFLALFVLITVPSLIVFVIGNGIASECSSLRSYDECATKTHCSADYSPSGNREPQRYCKADTSDVYLTATFAFFFALLTPVFAALMTCLLRATRASTETFYAKKIADAERDHGIDSVQARQARDEVARSKAAVRPARMFCVIAPTQLFSAAGSFGTMCVLAALPGNGHLFPLGASIVGFIVAVLFFAIVVYGVCGPVPGGGGGGASNDDPTVVTPLVPSNSTEHSSTVRGVVHVRVVG